MWQRLFSQECKRLIDNNPLTFKEETGMKLAVTSTGKNLDSPTDPRFGRAQYFIIVDTDTMAFEAVENTQNLQLAQGAGIQAGKTIINQKVDALVTGFCGPKAFMVLDSAKIKIYTGTSGTVKDAVSQFKEGSLELAQQANVQGHWV